MLLCKATLQKRKGKQKQKATKAMQVYQFLLLNLVHWNLRSGAEAAFEYSTSRYLQLLKALVALF